MQYIENLIQNSNHLLVQFIFILGIVLLIVLIYDLGVFLLDVIHAILATLSITYCTVISAMQKADALNTTYYHNWNHLWTYMWETFIFHLYAEGIEYTCDDFRWNGIFDFDTYNTHIQKK